MVWKPKPWCEGNHSLLGNPKSLAPFYVFLTLSGMMQVTKKNEFLFFQFPYVTCVT